MTERETSATPVSGEPPLDLPLDEVLDRLAGDRALLAVLADLHRRESVVVFEQMRGLLEGGDAAGLEHAAHRLAGSLLVFSADTAASMARHIEQLASSGDLAVINPHLAPLEFELHRVNAALERALQA